MYFSSLTVQILSYLECHTACLGVVNIVSVKDYRLAIIVIHCFTSNLCNIKSVQQKHGSLRNSLISTPTRTTVVVYHLGIRDLLM